MQLTKPIDVEAALAADIKEFVPSTWDVRPQPAPENLVADAPIVRVYALGGHDASVVSDEYSVSLDVWAGDGDDYSLAIDAACDLAGVIASLPFRTCASKRDWMSCDAVNKPQPNPDTRHPTVPRVTQNWNVTIRGILT
ncbi:MAG: hypothetical protein IKE43_09475 [Coriobacteriales bacterium]|nr:hypothetical protein [Coriobacteriales bacterium]